MLTVALASRLLDVGVLWTPQQGDRFVLPGRGMDDDVFWLNDLTVEVHELPRGRVVGFNGTTEWALDSVRLEDALWLPREDQLRALLGERFVALQRTASGWVVQVTGGGRFHHDDVECAYALAVLDVAGNDGEWTPGP